MTAEIKPILPMPGTKDLYTLLEVINNKEKYQRILFEIETQRKEANRLIDLVGKSSEIEKLHKESNLLNRQRLLDFEESEKLAKLLISEAEDLKKDVLSSIKKGREELDNSVKSFKKDFEQFGFEKEKMLEKVNLKMTEADNRLIAANKLITEAESVKKEYNERITKYKENIKQL